MTDLDKLKALLTEFGVEFCEEAAHVTSAPAATLIECRDGSKGVAGYPGFMTEFAFDRSGKFISMGAYE